MGIRRIKTAKGKPADGVPKLTLSEQASTAEVGRSNVYGDDSEQFPSLGEAYRGPSRKTAKGSGARPQKSGASGAEAAGFADAGAPSGAVDLAAFEDFWGDDGGSVEQVKSTDEDRPRGSIRISTPTQSPNMGPAAQPYSPPSAPLAPLGPSAPLRVFKVATPPQSPREKPQEKQFASTPPWPYGSKWPFNCAPTTLELRSLPRGVTAEIIINQLSSWGFGNRCNLVYVSGAGQATVNAGRHADGCALAARLHNFSDWKVKGAARGSQAAAKHKQKACRVAWSFTCQGLDAHVMAYHQDMYACWYDSQNAYVGPWILYGNAWWALFSPVHMWPVAYVPSEFSEWPEEEGVPVEQVAAMMEVRDQVPVIYE